MNIINILTYEYSQGFTLVIFTYEYSQGFIQQKKLVELRLTNNKIFKVCTSGENLIFSSSSSSLKLRGDWKLNKDIIEVRIR